MIQLKDKVCIVLGSSNCTGTTYALLSELINQKATLMQLINKKINFFDYKNHYNNDEFLDCLHTLLDHEIIVFASPVYWYNISAQLKIFMDRLTDLIYFETTLLSRLQSKKFIFVTTYSNDAGYAVDIMKKTFNYLKLPLLNTMCVQQNNVDDKHKQELYQICADLLIVS